MAQPSDLAKMPGNKKKAVIDEQAAQSQNLKAPPQESSEQVINDDELANQIMGSMKAEKGISNEPTPMPQGADPNVDYGDNKSVDQALQELARDQAYLNESKAPQDEFQMAEPGEAKPIGALQEFKARAIQHIGSSKEDQLKLLQKALGSNFDVRLKDNEEIVFRKKGSSKFFPIDATGFSGGLREVVGDIIDFSGDVLEQGAASIGAVTSVATGGATGLALGGAGGAAVGGTLGVAAAPAVGALTGVAARRAAIEHMIGSTSEGFMDELKLATAFNYAALGLGAIVKSAAKRSLETLKDSLELSPISRVKQLAEVRQNFGKLADEFGEKTFTKGQAGQQAYDAIEAYGNKLDKKVRLVRDDLKTKLGDTVQPVERYVKELENVLNDLGVSQDQLLTLKSSGGKAKSLSKLVKGESNPAAEEYAKILANAKEKSAAGSDTGHLFIKKIMDEYINVNKDGGYGALTLFDKLDLWKLNAAYVDKGAKVDYPKATQALSRRIRQALAEDRNEIITNAFGDSKEKASIALGAIDEFAKNIDDVKRFKKLFMSGKNPEKFTDALVQPGNSKQLQKLKNILGEESNEFGQIQAEYIDKVFNKALNARTGVIDGDKILKTMQATGDDMLNVLMSKDQQLTLQLIAKRSQQIAYEDILNNPQAKEKLKDAAAVAISRGRTIGPAVRLLWSLTRANADAAKYLSDEGLIEVAVNIKDPFQRTKAVKVIEFFQHMLNATDIRKSPATGKNYLVPFKFEEKMKDPAIVRMLQQYQEGGLNRSFQAPKLMPRVPGANAFGISATVRDAGKNSNPVAEEEAE